MKPLNVAVLIAALTGSSMAISNSALADESGSGMHLMHGEGYGMRHGGDCWRSTLSEAQSKQIDLLKVDYKKKLYPLKAKIKQAKIDLALLMTADNPKQKEIDKKLDELSKLKAEKMHLKTAHQIEVRKILTSEQRVKFDMKLLHQAYQDKRGHGYYHH